MSSTILDKINQQRRTDVDAAKQVVSLEEIRKQALASPFPVVSLVDRLRLNAGVAVMAEVKRASPSKGDIAPNIDAAAQGLTYAKAGAAAISCLTEPHWFKGTLDDMKGIRMAIDGLSERPALLRKDFLIDEYQVYEARAYGADSVLLIVASLKQQEVESGLLTRLLKLARELGMEPLVEVNSDDEMHIALQIGAKVIGINNRNLHNFHVDMDTTKRLLNGKGTTIPEDVIVAALSGIVTRDDVKHFEAAGAKAILVGETLMRSSDPARKILELQGFVPPIVKICGVKTVEMAIATAEAGADMIGLVFAQGSKRLVSVQLAKEIADAIRQWRRQQHSHNQQPPTATTTTTTSSNTANTEYVDSSRRMHEAVQHAKPLLVGVFANNSLDEVNQIAAEVGLDYVQLSGHEGFEAARQTKQPCIRALHVGNGTITELLTKIEPGAAALLLDTMDPTALGGTGRAFNWDIAVQLSATTPFFLAGGLTPDNVGGAVRKVRPFGIDVSSGVETDGQKDITKIKDFVKRAKLVEL